MDETLIGGRTLGAGKGRHLEGKAVVLGMVERGGDVVTQVVPNVRKGTLIPAVEASVTKGGTSHTDHLHSYHGLRHVGYAHDRVNHTVGEYVRGDCHTQTIEGFWAQVKRGVNGTHIHVSPQHLPKYLAEFEYRWNMRQVPHLMLARLMTSFAR